MREKLEAAFLAAFGPVPPSEYDGRAWTRNEPDFSPVWTAYIAKRSRFTRLLDAEAWLDAAMMLRLEGHRIKFTICEDGRAAADTWVHGVGPDPVGPSLLYDTPAEALLAAIEKART